MGSLGHDWFAFVWSCFSNFAGASKEMCWEPKCKPGTSLDKHEKENTKNIYRTNIELITHIL